MIPSDYRGKISGIPLRFVILGTSSSACRTIILALCIFLENSAISALILSGQSLENAARVRLQFAMLRNSCQSCMIAPLKVRSKALDLRLALGKGRKEGAKRFNS